MKKYKIIYHFLPYEIDYALLSFQQLKKSSFYLDEKDSITIETCLNLSDYLIDWSKSKLPKEFFISKYNDISALLIDYNHIKKTYQGNQLYGHLDVQREAKQEDVDFYINICPDMYFSETLLMDLINASKIVSGAEFEVSMDIDPQSITNSKYFVITPDIAKMWDYTWDEITNEHLVNKTSYQDWDKQDLYKVRYNIHRQLWGGENLYSYLEKTEKSKFAGWFDLYNKAYWEEMVPVRDDFKGYGPLDWYSMICSEKVKDFSQYILRNQVIFEYSVGPLKQTGFSKYYKDLLHFNDIPNQRKDFESKMPQYLKDWENYAIEKQII